MPARTTINQSDSYDAAAAEYRDHPPLRPALLQQKKHHLRSNAKLLSIYYIDMITRLHEQRALLKAVYYIKLVILGGNAFLATSEGLGASKELKHFV